MPIESRYLHTLVVKRMAATGTLDDYGQPVTTETTVATVAGLIQPRPPGTEVPLTTQAGVVISRHVGYLTSFVGLGTDCWFEDSHFPGTRFDVLDLADEGGLGHHLAAALRAVT